MVHACLQTMLANHAAHAISRIDVPFNFTYLNPNLGKTAVLKARKMLQNTSLKLKKSGL